MYQFYIKRQTITIDGGVYLPDSFKGKGIPAFALKSDFHYQLYLFLKDWFSRSPFLIVKTSGSTGTPKEMTIEKERMMQSAKQTCSFLDLKNGDKALLCMSLDYIAGKMMVVRALVAGLDLYLITPSGNPLKETDISFDFAAMIPMQVYNSLQSDVEKDRLGSIKNLLIGGGAVDPTLAAELKLFPNNVYSSYGMTETLSHIALRKLNGVSVTENYIPFESVTLSLSEDNTLIIDAPLVSAEKLYTNDVVEIKKDGSFRIVGRRDNVVNSGGVKIQIEEVEMLLKPFISVPFAISSLSDVKFGEILVLVVETNFDITQIEDKLPAYYLPKKVIEIETIPLTETGKVSRVVLKRILLEEI